MPLCVWQLVDVCKVLRDVAQGSHHFCMWLLAVARQTDWFMLPGTVNRFRKLLQKRMACTWPLMRGLIGLAEVRHKHAAAWCSCLWS